MSMTTNALEWLRQCPPVAARHDRTRASTVEKLETGDVLDDGSILCDGGLVLARGRVNLTECKARAAAYYGWTEKPLGFRVVDGLTGERLYMMERQ